MNSGSTDKLQMSKAWRQEDQLINSRITWFGATQALLLGAIHGGDLKFSHMVAIVGFYSSSIVLVGVIAAITAQVILWFRSEHGNQPGRLGVSIVTTVLGWFCALGICAVFVCMWGVGLGIPFIFDMASPLVGGFKPIWSL